MDEAFTERLATIVNLSPDDIATLEDELTAAFDAADASGDVDQMQSLADALEAVREESARRGTAETPVDPEVEAPAPAAASEQVPVAAAGEVPVEPVPAPVAPAPVEPAAAAPVEPPPAADPVTPPVPTEPPAPAEPVVAAEPVAPTPEPEVTPTSVSEPAPSDVVSSGTPTDIPPTTPAAPAADPQEEAPVAELTADDVPAENTPVTASGPDITFRAGGDIPGITSGTSLDGMEGVTDALVRKLNGMRGIGGDGEQIIVASLAYDVDPPDERTLHPGDFGGNMRKIQALISDPDQLTPEALTAAGWCAPRAPIYDVPTIGTTDRPLRDALPTFSANRGGIVWMQPPALPSLFNAQGVWKYDTGESEWESFSNPEGTTETTPANTKPCVYVPCGTEANADLEALTQCLCFDNMTARAFPEWIRANTDLTMVAQARFSEQWLLNKLFIAAGAADTVTPTTQFGITRDLLTMIRLVAAQFRWRYRLSPTAPLQWVAPDWLHQAIADDLTLQHPAGDTMSVANSEINGYLADANIQPIWYIDDAPGTEAFDGYDGFPTVADWVMFPTGAYTRLDGGSLDLGVTRSKEDIQKNRYCQFAETFETLAYMGPANSVYAIHGQTPVNIMGAYTAPISMTGDES